MVEPAKIISLGMFALALLGVPIAAAQPLSGEIREIEVQSAHVPAPAAVSVYTPPDYDANRAEPYPLLIQLHGGGGSHKHMNRMAPMLEQAIASGRLPPVVSVMPDAGRSFYMDYRDGSQKWESYIVEELLPYMRDTYNVVPGRDGTLITGISMGGMGAIRIAFKHPDKFEAVASMEPGIEPSLEFDEIELRDRFWRSPELFAQIYGDPVDEEYWAANHPANIAAADPDRLVDLAIFLEAGDQDMFYLHHGAELLHRTMFDAGISHEYRLVRGADHVGPSLKMRFLDAMEFFDRVLDPPDWVNQEVTKARTMVNMLKRRGGFPVKEHDPRKVRVE